MNSTFPEISFATPRMQLQFALDANRPRSSPRLNDVSDPSAPSILPGDPEMPIWDMRRLVSRPPSPKSWFDLLPK